MSALLSFVIAGFTFLSSGIKIIGNSISGKSNLALNYDFGLGDNKKKEVEVDEKEFAQIKKNTKGNSNSWDKNKIYDDDRVVVPEQTRVTNSARYSVKNTKWLLLIGGFLGIFILSYMYMTDAEFRDSLKDGVNTVGKNIKEVATSKKYPIMKILLGVACLIALILLYLYYIKGDSITLTTNCNAKTDTVKIEGSKIKLPKEGLQWSYNMWLYIENWEYNYGQKKTFFHKDNHLKMSLGEKNPTLHLTLTTDNGNEEINVEKICKDNDLCTDGLNIEKWNMITLTVNNKNVRFYHNGNLIIGRKLKGLPVLGESGIKIGNKSFDGLIKNVKYYKRILSDGEIKKMSRKNPALSITLKNLTIL